MSSMWFDSACHEQSTSTFESMASDLISPCLMPNILIKLLEALDTGPEEDRAMPPLSFGESTEIKTCTWFGEDFFTAFAFYSCLNLLATFSQP